MKHFVLASLCLVLFSTTIVSPATAQTCTGTNNSTVTGSNDASVGTLAWANPNDIAATDGQYATVSALVSLSSIIVTTTQYLTATNLGFNIPSTYNICGVTVTINRQTFSILTVGGSYTTDNSIKLIKGGVITGTDHAATTTQWPTTLTPATYGTSSDLWGTTLTPADVNSSNFGVAISATLTAAVASIIFNAQIDQVVVTVYASNPAALPVNIQSFTAVATPGGNQLNWTATANDAGNRMVVQRSADQSTWENLNTMTADQTATSQEYSYLDATPLLGDNFYRLELINSNGSTVYSQIVHLEGKTVTNIRFYPNPFTDMINITSPTAFSRITLRDVQGKPLFSKNYDGGGVNSAQIPASTIPAGLYFVQVDGTTYKLVKK